MREAELLHTAARRYCMQRAESWRAKYGEVARRHERPAKSGLLSRLGLTVSPESSEGRAVFPRYIILDAMLDEIERRAGSEFASTAELTKWLVSASHAAFEAETRPPDLTISSMKDAFSREVRERIKALGPKAKIVVGQTAAADDGVAKMVMKEECDAFIAYISTVPGEIPANVSPLPFRRTLRDDESERLWSLLKSRWGVDGYWYPLDRSRDDIAPRDAVAFQATAFSDMNLVTSLQGLLRHRGLARVYELREGRSSADREIDVGLLRPWYNLDEGFWLDDSGNWIVYASHEGSVTVGGSYLLPGLQEVWRDWREYMYAAAESGVEREVGPGVWSTTVWANPATPDPPDPD